MSVIVLLAVGSDYNLLLVSRMKEEIGAGINTGIIRAMGGTGKVVTNAGLVFAFTMASMAVSDLRTIAQMGTTIGLGLLFDTLVVRAFMTPSIAALLGRWFWWPQRVRPRPASSLLRSVGPRPLVRALLLREQAENDGPAAPNGHHAAGCGPQRQIVRRYDHARPQAAPSARTFPAILRSTGDLQVFAARHPGLGGADSAGDFRGSIAGARRARAFRIGQPQDAPSVQAMTAHGQGLQRIRFGQFRDDRAGGAAAARG